MSRKVTLQSIADSVGFSKFAVSRALAGKSGVTPDTRDKIIEAATKLGYFNQLSKSHKAKTKDREIQSSAPAKRVIAVVIPNLRDQTKDNPYWGKILEGITESIEKAELNMILITEQLSDHLFSAINQEGLLGYICVGFIPTQIVLEINNLGLPFVLVDHEDPFIPSDSIFMNNFDCTRQLTSYLIGLGHRNLQFVGDISIIRSYYDRWKGYSAALEDNGIASNQHPDLLKLFDMQPEKVREAALSQFIALQSKNALPTAFVCINDHMADVVIETLQVMGLQVPRDCSVTGFDDLDAHSFGITTVLSAKNALGRRAVEMLQRRSEQPAADYEKILFAGKMIIKKTTSAPLA
ncbi:LacI family DNA-binding transcriptional regulator [Paenibacillus mendelii]|uniref:LacI family DNA-binding transcriptional regulator n=1 Tax=Paenibacillus mendelii TaxID=206163 RepID=A0ABV6J2W6_9BACL|nr:LacI family DNA-binding transcriptional regulator [Paenibacillus mendelii]MCQ6559241.1 LacI family DNA-binding transcriptional regulator [Paenibacillus mendelii]